MFGFLELEVVSLLAGLELLGYAGALLIAAAWVIDAVRVLQTRHSHLDLKFGAVYFFGSLALTVYAFSIDSFVFSFLNFLATMFALFSLYYAFKDSKERSAAQAVNLGLDKPLVMPLVRKRVSARKARKK